MLGLNFSGWVAQQRDKPLLPAKLSELRLHLSDVRQSLHVAGQGVAVDQARVCFNASPVTAHPTEAQLFRSATRTGGAQLFDEVETLQGDRYRFDALISVLHVGFERGGVVTRLERRDERFVGDIPGDWR